MNESPTTPKRDYIDFGEIIHICLKYWYIILGSVIFCLLMAFVYNRRTPSEYLVRTNLLVVQDDEGGLPSPANLGSLFGTSADVQDELFAVKSFTLYRQVARELDLNVAYYVRDGFMKSHRAYGDNPIAVEIPPQFSDTTQMGIGFNLKVNEDGVVRLKAYYNGHKVADIKDGRLPLTLDTEVGKFTFKATEQYPKDEKVGTAISVESYDVVAENLMEKIDVDLESRKANVIYLETEATNVELAKAILNAIVRDYNARGLEEKNARTQKTLDFLDSRLALLSTDLAQSESQIQDFKTRHAMPDIEAEAKYQYTKRGTVEAELIEAETEQRLSKMLCDYLADPANARSLVPATLMGASNNAAAMAIEDYNKRIVFRDRLASTVSADNKTLRELDQELDLRRTNLISTLNKNLDAANIKVSELRSKYNATQGSLGSVPSQERIYRSIERERTIRETLYIFLLQHREERAIMLANGQLKGRVIDEAYASTDEIGMSNKRVYILAFILGCMMGLGLVYLKMLLRTKFSSRAELEKFTSAPVLGEVCTDRSGRSLIVRAGGSTSAAELFRLIRSNLQFILNGDNDKVILMTSTRSGEGKSFISINLAASLALLNKRVLLIGADVRNAKLAEYLDLPHATGLTEYLSSDRYSVNDIIRTDPLKNGVDIITAGPVPPNPSELLSGPRLAALIDKLRETYDYIIIDSAPVGMVSDTFAMGALADATVYVTRANYTTRRDLDFFNEVYTTKRLPKIAVVVNGTQTQKGYGYGYGSTSAKEA